MRDRDHRGAESGLQAHESRHRQGANAWTGLVADAKIKFQLATKDPDGMRTDGIVRVQTDRASFGPGDGVKTA